MNVSAWAIRQPVPALLLFILLTLAGLVGFHSMEVQNFPDIDLPSVTVTISLPGATPSQLETEVTRKVEDTLANIGNVDHIISTVTDGSTTITVQFELDKDINEAVNDVRDAVSRIRSQLPTDAQEPVIARVNLAGAAIVTYSIQSKKRDAAELSWLVDHDIGKLVLGVPGVAQVTRVGGIDREVRIDLHPAALLALNLTAADVSRQLRLVEQDTPAGVGRIGSHEQAVRVLGKVTNLDQLRAISIPLSDGRHVRLDSIATIQDAAAEQRQGAYLDGQPVISLEVYRARGAGEVHVARDVQTALDAFTQQHPDVVIRQTSTTVRQVEDSYRTSMNMLYEGALLAVVVVGFFLKEWRATTLSAIALPLSVIPTFAAMAVLGYSLNTVTLLALSLVVGILVDDAIVEVENIVRHLRMGKSPMEAALDAAQEIGLAVIATTFTLVAVFLPTAFMSGIPGKFFKQFGWTAAIAVLFSLLVARLLTPMMAAYGLKAQPSAHADGTIMQTYLHWVRRCLNNRGKTVIAALTFFALSLYLAHFLDATFMPAAETGQINLSVELPPGTALPETLAVAEAARKVAKTLPDISTVYTAIGSSTAGPMGQSGGASDPRKATMILNLAPHARAQNAIEAELRQKLLAVPGARFSIGLGQSGEKLAVVLASDDANLLNRTAQAIARDMRSISGLGNIVSSASLLRPEIEIEPNVERAAELGVSTSDIGDTARIATSGDFDASVAKYDLPERQLYVRVRLDDAARQDIATWSQLRVPGHSQNVPLTNVATLRMDSGPSQIDRLDRSRYIQITGELGGRPLGEMMQQVNALPSMRQLPPGVQQINFGDLEHMKELFGSFGLAMAAGVLCVYVVLVLLFKDFLQPLTILAALPLSLGGALGFLLITGYSMSMPALIGLLTLMGIVTKNSILLVEYAIMARREHALARFDALVDACHKRARPILMTSIAMTAGMFPLALGLEGDSSFRAPMAVAVMGGLTTSTLLSLLVVPVVFSYVDDLSLWLATWKK